MRAEVVSVGTELLLGDIVNTNAAWIGRALADAGIDCLTHTCVGDNEQRIADAIDAALARADAVIVTGGIGPTQDDVTREAVARLTGRPLRRDPAIAEWIRARFAALGRAMAENNLRQADVPEGARVIEQTQGTAPGLIVEHRARPIYVLPGVPSEMEDMMRRAVLPDLAARAGTPAVIRSRVVRTAGLTESGIAEQLSQHWDAMSGGVTMAFLAGGGEVRVRLTAKAGVEEEARALLDEAERAVRATLGHAVVGSDDQRLEVVVGELLRARGWTLACAESLTGGAVGARITEVSGASSYFRGAVVAYASDEKSSLLEVDPGALSRRGVVSEAVAVAMAEGARRLLHADVACATTGVAGPDPQDGVAPGNVHLAVAGPLGVRHRHVRYPGTRQVVRTLAVAGALNLVRLYLLEATG